MLNEKQKAAQELLNREASKTSLLAFTEYTHPNWESSHHHEKMCGYLEKLERSEVCLHCQKPLSKLAVFAPPRHGKTELVSRRFPAWCVGRHPEWQMICAQATGLLASDTGADVRNIVASPEYKMVFPGIELRQDAKAANRWATQSGGIYYAAGVDGTIVGRGANLLDIDDPHKGREDADSQRMRDIAGNWYFGNALTRMMTPSLQLLTLTRWHEDDLAGRILPAQETWWTTPDFQYFCADDWHVLRMRAVEIINDTEIALWPGRDDKRFPLSRLKDIRSTLTKAGRAREWTAQYQQSPAPEDGEYIKREWFAKRYKTKPPRLKIYMASDFAVSAPREGARDPDYTEHGVFGVSDEDLIYPIDWWCGQTTPDIWIDKLIELFEKHQPIAWFGEAGPIRRAIEAILKKRMMQQRVFVRTEWVPSTKDKSARGRPFQAWASSGRIVWPENEEWSERVIENSIAFPSAKHDDAFDVMSLMLQVVDQMHPAMKAVSKQKERAKDAYGELRVIEGGLGWKSA